MAIETCSGAFIAIVVTLLMVHLFLRDPIVAFTLNSLHPIILCITISWCPYESQWLRNGSTTWSAHPYYAHQIRLRLPTERPGQTATENGEKD